MSEVVEAIISKENEVLNFSNKSLTTLDISKHACFGRITEIYVDHNDIETLPSVLCELINLRTLSCIGNALTELPNSIDCLRSLEVLNLNENDLQGLPDTFVYLSNLTCLSLVGNAITQLPGNFGKLQRLETLKLDENALKELPDSFGDLNNIRVLELNSNKLRILPTTFGQLSLLKVLNLNDNKLEGLPESFSELQNLSEIDLSNNFIKLLPQTMKSSKNLRKLYLDNNELEELPKWIQYLPMILELQLKDNRLQKNPLKEEFGLTNKNLKVLDIGGNFIRELPETFAGLDNLEFIHLGSIIHELERRNFQNGNWLSRLPYDFGKLKNLRECHLDENQLLELPDSFCELKNLQFLDLGQNNIQYLPKLFGNLTSLKACLLSKNHIKCLPKSFGELSALTDLRIDNNQIMQLPKTFGKLTQLKTLDLFNNLLREVPDCLPFLVNLIRLDLDQNKLKLKNRDIPMIVHNLRYAPRDATRPENWRGKIRADQTIQGSVIQLPPSGPDDEEPQQTSGLDSSVMERAMRQHMSLWKSSHTNTDTQRPVYERQFTFRRINAEEFCDSELETNASKQVEMKNKGKSGMKSESDQMNNGNEEYIHVQPLSNGNEVAELEVEEDWDSEIQPLDVAYHNVYYPVNRWSTREAIVYNRNGFLTDKLSFIPDDVHAKPLTLAKKITMPPVYGQFSDVDDE